MAAREARAQLTEAAAAKINLTLHILGRRADGYHELESLVVFARIADRLTLVADQPLSIEVVGPTAAAAGAAADNLVLKAARNLADLVDGLQVGCFLLEKTLPVAAGIGGGSADAAAALRLLARLNGLDAADPRLFAAARDTGADVPVCIDPKPRVMRGIGEVLSLPLALPELPTVLINPGVAAVTKEVFAALRRSGSSRMTPPSHPDVFPHDAAEFLALLRRQRNGLEPAATSLYPAIADVLTALNAAEGCHLARMSGSGSTCFGIFGSAGEAEAAARLLQADHPGWWIRATSLGAA